MDEVKKMRLRNVKGSREMIATNDFVVHEEETMKGKWHDFLKMKIRFISKWEWEKADLL